MSSARFYLTIFRGISEVLGFLFQARIPFIFRYYSEKKCVIPILFQLVSFSALDRFPFLPYKGTATGHLTKYQIS